MYDAVVTINNTHWPAYRNARGTLIDLRLFDPIDRSPKPRLIFRPEKLHELGIPEKLVEAAAQSQPQGLILFEDLPDQTPQIEAVPANPSLNPQTEPEDRVTSGFSTRSHLLERSNISEVRCVERQGRHSLHRRERGHSRRR